MIVEITNYLRSTAHTYILLSRACRDIATARGLEEVCHRSHGQGKGVRGALRAISSFATAALTHRRCPSVPRDNASRRPRRPEPPVRLRRDRPHSSAPTAHRYSREAAPRAWYPGSARCRRLAPTATPRPADPVCNSSWPRSL